MEGPPAQEIPGNWDDPVPDETPVECGLCFDSIEEPFTKIDDSPVCDDCIRDQILPKFENALKHEFHYPVEWNPGSILEASTFAEQLGTIFVKRYEQMEQEYKTPPGDRVYCRALIYAFAVHPRGAPVQRRTKLNGPQKVMPRDPAEAERDIKDGKKLVECGAMACKRSFVPSHRVKATSLPICWSCNRRVCHFCGVWIYNSRDWDEHKCPREKLDVNIDLSNLKRGADYQICPNPCCQGLVAHFSGCNWVRCPRTTCNWGLCFICGKGPLEDGDPKHWRVGGCPRFNQRFARNAIYDGFR